jgi:hypothetical protein
MVGLFCKLSRVNTQRLSADPKQLYVPPGIDDLARLRRHREYLLTETFVA